MKKLNNYIRHTLLISSAIFALFSCDNDVEINKQIENSTSISDMFNSVSDFQESVMIGNELLKGIDNVDENRSRRMPLVSDLKKRDVIVEDWAKVDEKITAEFNRHFSQEKEISYDEAIATRLVQNNSLVFLKKYMMKVDVNEESGKVSKKYLSLLLRHKSIDLDIMTDILLKYQEQFDENYFSMMKTYLLKKANQKSSFVSDNLEKYQKEFNSQDGGSMERINTIAKVKNLQASAAEVNYVRRRLEKN